MRFGRRSRTRSRESSSAYYHVASFRRTASPHCLLIKTTTARAHSESQRTLLQNALAVANRVPANNFVGGAANVEEAAWKNCWNWCVVPPSSVPLSTCARCGQILSLLVAFPSDRNLPDAQYGNLILDVRDGRMGSEMKSQGEHYGEPRGRARSPPS